MIFGMACSSLISALFSELRARFVRAPSTFNCASMSGELRSVTSRFNPPASRTAFLLSSSMASCMMTLAAVCFKDSLAERPGCSRFRARAEFFSELICCRPAVGKLFPTMAPSANSAMAASSMGSGGSSSWGGAVTGSSSGAPSAAGLTSASAADTSAAEASTAGSGASAASTPGAVSAATAAWSGTVSLIPPLLLRPCGGGGGPLGMESQAGPPRMVGAVA
mmetsp:Transcript_52781/g.112980  ORF Transcript_52781/g.112980 Transcript_52781/m.112980 type:complete len:222 (+) Transcript_52781:2118-2783(+)